MHVFASRNVSSIVTEMKFLQICEIIFPLCPSFLESTLLSIIHSGYAWARSKCVTSWFVECAFQDCGERILRTCLTLIRCVVFVSCTRVSLLAIAPSGLSLI